MLKVIGGGVVFGFALYGLGKYLTRPSIKFIRLRDPESWAADRCKDGSVKPGAA